MSYHDGYIDPRNSGAGVINPLVKQQKRLLDLEALLKEKKTPLVEPSVECSTCQYYERCFTHKKESKTLNLMNLLGGSKDRSGIIDEKE